MSEVKIDEDFLVCNYSEMTVVALAKHFGVSRSTVQRRAKKYGLEKEETYIPDNKETIGMLGGELSKYGVTTKGRVVNTETNKVLKTKLNHNGYPMVTMQVNGERYERLVHRLVGELYIDNPENKPYINHIDGNKENYNVDNLEWCTPQENAKHASETGLLAIGEFSGTNKITEKQAKIIVEELNKGTRQVDIMREYVFATRAIIQKIQYGITWKHLSEF